MKLSIVRKFITVFILSAILLPCKLLLAIGSAPADKIKAAYIYQFTQFTGWPDDNIRDPDKLFTICVIGNDPITKYLQPISSSHLDERTIVIKSFNNSVDIIDCEILYIAQSAKKNLSKIIKIAQGHSILTVSSIPEFINNGGMINFVIVEERVRLKVNLDITRDANLKISAKLLEISLDVLQSADHKAKVGL